MPNVVYLPDNSKHIMPHFIPNHFLSSRMSETIKEIIKCRMINRMYSRHPNSIRMIQEFLFENQSYATILEDCFSKTFQDITNVKYYIDDNLNIMMVSPNNIAIIMKDQAILFTDTKEQIYVNDKQLYIKLHDTMIMYNIDKYNFSGVIKSDKVNEKMNITMDDNNMMYITLDYTENNFRLTSKMLKMEDGSFYNIYRENHMNVTRSYDYKKNQRRFISECMMNGNDGIRFRGQYSELTQNNKVIDKAIKKDDITLYEKKDEEVLIDNINNMKIRTDIMIGWKAVKTDSGEWRVLKLAIHPDAQLLRPIDKNYFDTFDKMRCDRAIVIDIQLPIKEEHISVVPEEREVVSCIHKETTLKYIVGMEVIPDSYNADPDVGCSNGIHFFLDRMSTFNAYIEPINME